MLAGLLARTQVTDPRGQTLGLDAGCERAVGLILAARRSARAVFCIGNGGSAAIASHLQIDLAKAVGLRSLCFQDPPTLTALTNDLGYEHVYEVPLRQWASAGDLLIAISSSGQSENILRGVEAAVSLGCHAVTLSGFEADNPLRRGGSINIYVPSSEYGYVEVAHQAIAHLLTDTAVAAIRAQQQLERSLPHEPEPETDDLRHRWGRIRRLRPGAQTAPAGIPGQGA